MASWYSRTPQRGRYKFNAISDPRPFDLDAFIGLVALDLDPLSDYYELHDKDEQLKALAAAVRRVEASKKGGKTVREQKAAEKAAEAQRRDRQYDPHLQVVGESHEDRQRREDLMAERALAREAAQTAAGAPPEQGSKVQVDAFLAAMRCTTPAVMAAEAQAVELEEEAAPMEVGAAKQYVAEAAEDESSSDEGEAGDENEAPAVELEVRCQAPCMHACTMHLHEH